MASRMEGVALVLFGHGARDPSWARPLELVRAGVLMHRPETRVELAFLEYLSPTLPERVAQLVGEGVSAVRILPVFIAQGGHLKREVPDLVNTLRERHPSVTIDLLPVMGEDSQVLAAMADYACRCLDAGGGGKKSDSPLGQERLGESGPA